MSNALVPAITRDTITNVMAVPVQLFKHIISNNHSIKAEIKPKDTSKSPPFRDKSDESLAVLKMQHISVERLFRKPAVVQQKAQQAKQNESHASQYGQ